MGELVNLHFRHDKEAGLPFKTSEASNGMALDFTAGIALGSFVISVMSAVFSYRQLKSAREHNRVSVRPALVFSNNFDARDEGFVVEVRIQNRGLGPAFVKSVCVRLGGDSIVPADKNPIELALAKCLAGKIDYRLQSSNWSSPGYCLRPGDESLVLKVLFPKQNAAVRGQVSKLLEPAHFEMIYNSAYGEEFTLSS